MCPHRHAPQWNLYGGTRTEPVGRCSISCPVQLPDRFWGRAVRNAFFGRIRIHRKDIAPTCAAWHPPCDRPPLTTANLVYGNRPVPSCFSFVDAFVGETVKGDDQTLIMVLSDLALARNWVTSLPIKVIPDQQPQIQGLAFLSGKPAEICRQL